MYTYLYVDKRAWPIYLSYSGFFEGEIFTNFANWASFVKISREMFTQLLFLPKLATACTISHRNFHCRAITVGDYGELMVFTSGIRASVHNGS